MAKKKTLYAYVAGSADGKGPTVHDDSVVAAVETRLDAFVSSRQWSSKDVWVVNQREPPHWDLGLNLAIPAGRAPTASFLEDVAAVGTVLGALRRETTKAFVIGIHDAGSDETKDLFTVDSDSPDLEALRSAVGKALALT